MNQPASNSASTDIVTLLQEQNRLLSELVTMTKKTEHEEKRRRITNLIIKMIPYIIIMIILIWMYISITSYLASLDQQISQISDKVGGVFTTVNNQFDYIKTAFSNFFGSVKSIVPDMGGIFN